MSGPFNGKDTRDRLRQAHREADNNLTKIAVDVETDTPIPVYISDGSDLDGNTQTTIFNKTVPVADTEVSQALPSDCKGFVLRARGRSRVQLAFNSGDSGTLYITIPIGSSYEDRNFRSSQTLYFQASKAGETIEIIAYT